MSCFLICPGCGEKLSGVVDSRPSADGKATRRRRECAGCGQRWSTYEVSAKDYERLAPFLEEVERIAELRTKMQDLLGALDGTLTRISESRTIKNQPKSRNPKSKLGYSSKATPYPSLVAANKRANEMVARIYAEDAPRSTGRIPSA